jgi:uncharacterized repeat protein (TIGR03806 family)
MKKNIYFALLLFIFGFLLFTSSTWQSTLAAKEKLSDYGFFTPNLAEMQPLDGVVPYQLNTPLFSDYAFKARFIRLPQGAKVAYNPDQVFDFPVGTAIIKTFYYPKNFAQPTGEKTIIETRVLLHEDKGWTAHSYIWNDAQTEAYLEVAGGDKPITWKDEKGKKQHLNYSIPNKNQCKGCHNQNELLLPIGPSARQLNGQFSYAQGTENQLKHWQKIGMLEGLPSDETLLPSVPKWGDTHANLEARARTYLDINCAHCHNPKGPAKTSGLYLNYNETERTAQGIRKTPVAAGRGSGDRQFDIEPGNPDASILVYRMESTDPGEMMPELSRRLLHKEGIDLIRAWVKGMK